jgi:acetyl esterase/lipase
MMNPVVAMMLNAVDGIYGRWLERRQNQFSLAEDVELFADVPYMEDGLACHRMDIYRPVNAQQALPVMISLHGGGLVLCSKEVNRSFCAHLAKEGFLVFCVDYPLVPQSDVCGILRDVSAGLDKVADLVEDYGGDANRISLVGDSAGAFLGVYALAAGKIPALADAAGVRPSRLRVRSMGIVSGMLFTNLNDSTGICLRKDFYGKHPDRHPIWAWLSPDRPDIAGAMPPCWLVTSRGDPLRSQTLRFAQGLNNVGIRHVLRDMPLCPFMGHDFLVMMPEKPESKELLDEMCGFLYSDLKILPVQNPH